MSREKAGAAGSVVDAIGRRFAATRRQVFFGASLGALFAATSGVAAMPLRLPHRAGSVLSFHRDEPWFDATGIAHPWIPPDGYRGGRVPFGLSDEQLRRLDCYL